MRMGMPFESMGDNPRWQILIHCSITCGLVLSINRAPTAVFSGSPIIINFNAISPTHKGKKVLSH